MDEWEREPGHHERTGRSDGGRPTRCAPVTVHATAAAAIDRRLQYRWRVVRVVAPGPERRGVGKFRGAYTQTRERLRATAQSGQI